jgi:hypothetical protein
MIDVHQGLIDQTCSAIKQLITHQNDFGSSSQFGQFSAVWIGFLRDLRSFARIDPSSASRLVRNESYDELFRVVRHTYVESEFVKLTELLNSSRNVASAATQASRTQRTERDLFERSNEGDIEFMDEEESTGKS